MDAYMASGDFRNSRLGSRATHDIVVDRIGFAKREARRLLTCDVHPKIASMLEYWLSIAPDDRFPSRREFQPSAVPKLLPNIWLIDVVRADPHRHPNGYRFRYRLIGSKIVESCGADHPTGKFLDEVHESYASVVTLAYLAEVADRRMPSWWRGQQNAPSRRPVSDLERIYLPLCSDGTTVDIILALTVFFKADRSEW